MADSTDFVAVLVEALRRVRDEVEYARDLHEAQYLADKHVMRALSAVGDKDPDRCSSAYSTRRAMDTRLNELEQALIDARCILDDVVVEDPDHAEQLRQAISEMTAAIGDGDVR